MGGQYTRHPNDLAISGDESLRRRIANMTTLVTKIAMEESFDIIPVPRLDHVPVKRRLVVEGVEQEVGHTVWRYGYTVE